MFRLRRRHRASVSRVDRLHRSLSCPRAMDQPVRERTDFPVPGSWVCPAPLWLPETAKPLAFARASWLRNKGTKQTKLLVNGGHYRVLDSLFLLFGFFTQH